MKKKKRQKNLSKIARQKKLNRLYLTSLAIPQLPSQAFSSPALRPPLPPVLVETRHPHFPLVKRILPIIAALGAVFLLLEGLTIEATVSRTELHVRYLHATATTQGSQRSTILAQIRREAQAQNTAAALASIYPFSTQLVLSDPLTDNRDEEAGWEEDGSHCAFYDHAYHDIDPPSSLYQTCAAQHTDFTNFTFTIDMSMQKGDDAAYGGVIFRADPARNRYYVLAITAQGAYSLAVLYNHHQGDALEAGQAPVFHQGLHQANTLAVVARENHLAFYVNHQLVASVKNDMYQNGEIGVFTQAGQGETDVAYTHATVWQIS